ncbi:hypothetical protein TNIN_192671 [Trichonephila inaurata madagascariensis]|uniref:Uncharacterized protein n=1 Tax=Trichonephila inaurata madagascariensis TaxID=2747483 RepID=A0A8X6XZS6_9ARAC|nr:hypothetical protein TNIN_192671 [Trichonephila inaurata madagascariensis]
MRISHDTSSRLNRSSEELGFRASTLNPNVVNHSGKDGWRFYACGEIKKVKGLYCRAIDQKRFVHPPKGEHTVKATEHSITSAA